LLAVGCGGRQIGNDAASDAGDSGARDVLHADAPDGSAADVRDGSPADAADGSPGSVTVCSDPTYADCTSAPGCETPLGTNTDCAGCGDPSCAIANTLFTCKSANGCTSAVCAVGFANCDRSSPDCEAATASGASCLPAYLGSVGYMTVANNSAAAAIATDGSFFLGGMFTGTVSFGTPAAPDVRTVAATGEVYGFITRFSADGSYAWTQAFPAAGSSLAITGLAATADGGVVAVGAYSGSIDLDPGDAVQSHQTMTSQQQESFVVKLAADGSFVWGGTFASQSFDAAGGAAGVVIDGAGAVYVAASYAGDVDFDLGAGTAVHTSRDFTGEAFAAGAIVKLTPTGELSWVQTVDAGSCVPPPASITVATDGAIWILGDGSAAGSTCPLPAGQGGEIGVAAYGPDGTRRGYWGIGDLPSLMWPHSIAAGPNGSVYIGGGAWGLPDFDPGPGATRQLVGTSLVGGFVQKLGSDGRYLWAQTIAGGQVVAVAGAPDGGVIGLGQFGAIEKQSGAFVTKLDADGAAGWTFSSGSFPRTVVSSGTRFVVTGSNSSWNSDMDPGPGVDIVGASTLYLSRFNL
jgi:hypothetical protein